MLLSTEKPAYSDIFTAVPQAVDAIEALSIDDQLGLLWAIYQNMGGLITPAAPGATERIKLAGGLVYEVANLSYEEQLQFMRDLISRVNTPLTRAYGLLSSNNKLAFWYQLAQWMDSGQIIPIPEDYELSTIPKAALTKLIALDFNQQIAVLRLVIGKMGVDPLAA